MDQTVGFLTIKTAASLLLDIGAMKGANTDSSPYAKGICLTAFNTQEHNTIISTKSNIANGHV